MRDYKPYCMLDIFYGKYSIGIYAAHHSITTDTEQQIRITTS